MQLPVRKERERGIGKCFAGRIHADCVPCIGRVQVAVATTYQAFQCLEVGGSTREGEEGEGDRDRYEERCVMVLLIFPQDM